jgi:hypothetical protein
LLPWIGHVWGVRDAASKLKKIWSAKK